MQKTLDARGWECPRPVIETKKALQTESELTVIVDNPAARQNVSRLAAKSGCGVRIDEKDDGTYIHITQNQKTADAPQVDSGQGESAKTAPDTGKTVVLIASDSLGKGSEELGGILIRAFLHTFSEVEPKPDVLILINGGVKLSVAGSPVLEDLKALAESGTEILVCGTCTNYFELTEQVSVGEVSNAYTIMETLLQAGTVIRL